jgi:hypothetical protein
LGCLGDAEPAVSLWVINSAAKCFFQIGFGVGLLPQTFIKCLLERLGRELICLLTDRARWVITGIVSAEWWKVNVTLRHVAADEFIINWQLTESAGAESVKP